MCVCAVDSLLHQVVPPPGAGVRAAVGQGRRCAGLVETPSVLSTLIHQAGGTPRVNIVPDEEPGRERERERERERGGVQRRPQHSE